MLSRTEMAKVHTSFTPVEVQLLMFKNTLVKVEVLATLFFTQVKVKKYIGYDIYLSKKYPLLLPVLGSRW